MKTMYYNFNSIIRWNENPEEGNYSEDVESLLLCQTWFWPLEKQNVLRYALGLPELEKDTANW